MHIVDSHHEKPTSCVNKSEEENKTRRRTKEINELVGSMNMLNKIDWLTKEGLNKYFKSGKK